MKSKMMTSAKLRVNLKYFKVNSLNYKVSELSEFNQIKNAHNTNTILFQINKSMTHSSRMLLLMLLCYVIFVYLLV